jgi:hypothetical protein
MVRAVIDSVLGVLRSHSPHPWKNWGSVWEARFGTSVVKINGPSTHITCRGDHITALIIECEDNKVPIVQAMQSLAIASETNRVLFLVQRGKYIDFRSYMDDRDSQDLLVDDILLINNEVHLEIPEHLYEAI